MHSQEKQSQIFSDAIKIWQAGVAAVQGETVIRKSIQMSGRMLSLGNESINVEDLDRVLVFGAGKASPSMAAGLVDRWNELGLGERLPVCGQVQGIADSSLDELSQSAQPIELLGVRPRGENFPTDATVAASKVLKSRVQNLGERDLAIGLISGGGSALLALPIPPVTIEEKAFVAKQMMRQAATIHELNLVRRCLSQVKGGRLIERSGASKVLGLLISDVIGDDLNTIASGPTVPCQWSQRSEAEKALKLIARYDQENRMPNSIYRVLESQIVDKNDRIDSSWAKPAVTNQVLANNQTAIDAANRRACDLGYQAAAKTQSLDQGDANAWGKRMASELAQLVESAPEAKKVCLVFGGESTVNLCASPGRGGRNQQVVLATLNHVLQGNSPKFEKKQFCFLAAGTDGEDGPTHLAGGVFDHQILTRQIQRDEISHCLQRNDALGFLEANGLGFETGNTGTNVCDLQVLLVAPADGSDSTIH